jgi:hypothetical protein
MIGQGTLSFKYGSGVTDGIVFYRVLSPSLLYRVLTRKKRRDLISGKWLVIGNIIIWFKKTKYVYGIGENNDNRY